MLKSAWAKLGVIVGAAVIIAGFVAIVMPHYSVLQRTRSISLFAGIDDFSISPAKVKVYIPIKGQSLTIPVTVNNGEGETIFVVKEDNPAKFDNGYFAPNEDCGYKFTFTPSNLDLQGNTSDEVNVTIQRTAWHPQKHLEKGIAVCQTTNSTGISIVRNYVFEILN